MKEMWLKKSAAELVLNTFYYGFKAKDELRGSELIQIHDN